MNKYAVIMAGGSGQRLWPLSRQKTPKQIIKIINGKSLLEMCVDRIRTIFPLNHIYIVTNQEYKSCIQDHIKGIPEENILGEPVGRDTANAIGLAAFLINSKDPDSAMAVFSADQIIDPVEQLEKGINTAFEFVYTNPDVLLSLAIKAASPHTGFGYLKKGDATDYSTIFKVDQFKEKPDPQTAETYYQSGQYCWNSGMFLWKTAAILDEISRCLPDNYKTLLTITDAFHQGQGEQVLSDLFPALPKISIDYGVMEKARSVYMCQLDCQWQDVGSFEALAENVGHLDEQKNSIAIDTEFITDHCSGNVVISSQKDHVIAGIDIDDLIIIHTEDATLVCRKGQTDRLKQLLEKIDSKHK